MGRVYDMQGNEIPDDPRSGLGDFSIGANAWELLHPAQTQRDQQITGNPDDVQSQAGIVFRAATNALDPWAVYSDAIGNIGRSADASVQAATDAVTAAQDALNKVADTTASAGKWIVVGLVALALLEGMRKFK